MITKIIYKYCRHDFFENVSYTEDSKEYPTRKDILKSFRALKVNYESAVEIVMDGKDYVVCFDKLEEFKNGIVTLITYHSSNDKSEKKCPWKILRKSF